MRGGSKYLIFLITLKNERIMVQYPHEYINQNI